MSEARIYESRPTELQTLKLEVETLRRQRDGFEAAAERVLREREAELYEQITGLEDDLDIARGDSHRERGLNFGVELADAKERIAELESQLESRKAMIIYGNAVATAVHEARKAIARAGDDLVRPALPKNSAEREL